MYRYFPLHRVPHYGIGGNFLDADYATDNTLCLPYASEFNSRWGLDDYWEIKEFGISIADKDG